MADRVFFPLALAAAERDFCMYYLANGKNQLAAYRTAFPKTTRRAPDFEVLGTADELLARPAIQAFLEVAGGSESEIAAHVLREGMLSGAAADRMRAAQTILAKDQREGSRQASERWAETMKAVGAEIEMPVPPGATSVTVRFEDVVRGRATIQLPFGARLKLLQRAGMPWNDLDPDAEISELQKELLAREERLTIVHGGSGVGKSVLGAAFALVKLSIPLRLIWIVAPTYDLCAAEFQYVWSGFHQLYGTECAARASFVNTVRVHDMEISTIWGSRVLCFSLDRQEGQSVLGKEADEIILGEGSQIAYTIFQRKLLRAADRRAKVTKSGFARQTGYVRIFTTPNEFEGTSAGEWERVMKTTDRKPERMQLPNVPWHRSVYMREADVLENPAYSREVYDERKQTLEKEAFDEQYRGKMTRRSGLVVKEYDPRVHKIQRDSIPTEMLRTMRFGFGFDTGKHFAAILAGLSREPKLYLLGEVYTQEWSISENAQAVKELLVEVLGPVFRVSEPDDATDSEVIVMKKFQLLSGKVDMWAVDPSSQNKEDLMEHLDCPIDFEKFDLLPSIDRVRDLFRDDFVRLCEECEWLEWELGRYIWRPILQRGVPGRTMYEPRKKDDHAIDAMRFLLSRLFELGPSKDDAAPTTFEENWERQQRYEIVGHLVQKMEGPAVTNLYEMYQELA